MLRHVEIGSLVDVDVADAFEMREYGHARFFLHARHEVLAAARHDHVDGAGKAAEHEADRRAIDRRHELDRGLGQARGDHGLAQRIGDDERGEKALGAAAQDRGVARLQAKRRRRRPSRSAATRR